MAYAGNRFDTHLFEHLLELTQHHMDSLQDLAFCGVVGIDHRRGGSPFQVVKDRKQLLDDIGRCTLLELREFFFLRRRKFSKSARKRVY